jgi:hypothetical protein
VAVKLKMPWGNEPVQVQSAKRANVSLNGAGGFHPRKATAQLPTPRRSTAGVYQGAGVMASQRRHDRTRQRPTVGRFRRQQVAGAWYERRFKVPADWNGRHISIDFQRVSTDATVWINDKPPEKSMAEGELDITNLVTPGEEVTLRAFVVATVDQGEVMVLMGEAPGQNYTAKA